MTLARALGAALTAPAPAHEVTALLRGILTSEPTAWESDEQSLVRRVAGRLDTISDDKDRLLALARDLLHLLEDASSSDGVEALLEVFAERERFLSLMKKHADGIVSRTSLLSYVAEQRWPHQVRQRIAALAAADPSNLMNLMDALQTGDISWLEETLVA
jgi:hypothetical protein